MPASESSAAPASMTAAEKLRAKHEAVASHCTVMEDVVDEEDIAHPPPSMQTAPSPASVPPEISPKPMSEKAAGKQKARDEQDFVPAQAAHNGKAPLDTQSEELFPALGGGKKAPLPTQTPMAWGTNRPSSIHGGSNGVNGQINAPSIISSRVSTPTSGVLSPKSSNAPMVPQQLGTSSPQQLSLPGGRKTERIQLARSQLLPRDQLKRPLQEIVRNLNRKSKAKVEMRTGPNGYVMFEATGPEEAARQALKELAKEVGSMQHVKVPIPMSVRPHIICKQGAVIQGISKRTGARVQLPKAEEVPAATFDDDDGTTIDVSIEGDAVAAEMARQAIEAIVNERTSTVNMRLRDIPAEFYPFIAGPHNSKIATLENGRQVRVQIPQYHTWSDNAPPQPPSASMLPQFIPSQSSHIRISGDRIAAQEARAEIERHVQELRREITLSQVPIDRGRHQFILDNNASMHDFLQETGCAIILPPASEDTELLTVTGPQDRIEMGIDKVIDLASDMQMSRIDIARQHANAPIGSQAHARALTRYLQQRQAIERLERQYNARIVLPSDDQGSPDWEVFVKEGRNGIRARQDILNLINAHPPARLRHVDVDPFFHQHIHRQGAQRLREDLGVHLVAPRETEESQHMILVYEGPTLGDLPEYEVPKQLPSPGEVADFERNLLKAQQYILSLIDGQQDIAAASFGAPPKYHDKLRKFVDREQQDLPSNAVPVQISFVAPNRANGGALGSQAPTAAAALDQECLLRGPSNAVDEFASKVAAFVEAEKHDELERGHVTSFGFPQKYANYLIGKRGENINRYREEFDVDIQVKDGKVDIIGPKAKAETAKSRILALGKKLEDETTHVLKINPKYHREIIGAKGIQVNRLQDRHNVRVQFPRTAHAAGDDVSVGDDASEVGGFKGRRSNQGPDEVIIRGPSRGADAARAELLDLVQWTLDHTQEGIVSVAQRQLPSLIGQGGQEMESIRLSTGAQIDVPGRDGADGSGRVQIHIKGTKKQVDEARKILEQRAKDFDDSITRLIDIDRKYHGELIGSGGSNIRNIVIAAGGSIEPRDMARTIRFPRQESGESAIRVEGKQALVDKIIAAMEAFAGQKVGQTTEIVEVPSEKHRMLIGRGGEARRALEARFNIGLDIPRLTDQGPSRSQVKVSGQPADIEKAKAHILEITKDQEGETIQIPRKHHQTISDNGQFFRRLRNDHKVTVDHGDQKPPKRTTPAPRPQTNGGGSMPLITDAQSSDEIHRWDLVYPTPSAEDDGTIPWILRGTPESIAKARSALEKALRAAETQEAHSTGYLVLPDPKTYRFVIGPGGSQINAIRKETGCKINVPRDQMQGEAIEIIGPKEGVETARDIILEVVANSGQRGRG